MQGERLAIQQWKQLNREIAECQHCPRLVKHCKKVAREKRKAYADWDYWGKPVPNFGMAGAQLLIVGLAPAAHGANRTGRMFTGDRSGEWLYASLYIGASVIVCLLAVWLGHLLAVHFNAIKWV